MGRVFALTVFILLAPLLLSGQTSGKISGRVIQSASNEPVAGANIYLEGTSLGAASDLSGEFFILNVPPGQYRVITEMIGYTTVYTEDVQVSVNRTTFLDIALQPATLTAEEIVVVASKIARKRDQTSSIQNVSSKEIGILPVEDVQAIVGLQAGVVAGHFRGGRLNEVSYMVDGMQVDEVFRGEGQLVEIEPEAIQDLEVITGTFNAEYGRAMSGIVNAVTKDGGNEFHGAASVNLANYITSRNDIFPGLKNNDLSRYRDYKIQLSGPLYKKAVTFFSNVRFRDDGGYLNGIRRFNVSDSSNFSDPDPENWYSEHTGDGAYVPLNYNKNISFLGKITTRPLDMVKLSLVYSYNDARWQTYNHFYKYNPDGQLTNFENTKLYNLQLSHLLSNNAYYDLKLSLLDSYFGRYVFKNPLDPRYVSDNYSKYGGSGFSTGDQQKTHERRYLTDYNVKLDFTWQINKRNSIKTGLLYTLHDLDYHWSQIRNLYHGTDAEYARYQPVIYPDSSVYSDIYRVKPVELSGYIQDKIEFEEMVLNIGLRYDYFDPQTDYPSQRRNPANQLAFPDNPEKMSTNIKSDPQTQLSPRLGLAYQLSDKALLHFSYGHFFQMPPMYALYENHAFRVAPKDYSTTMGNAQLKAQKTVQYEVGLWQELVSGLGLEVSLFYRDIYSLLSTKIISTYNQIEYGLYTNKDYGNAKGLELKLDYTMGGLSAFVNYTLQYTRGNADDPLFNFDRAGNSRDPVPTLIPMSWDQRHTFNATIGYHKQNYGITATGYYNSGTPYTWTPRPEDRLSTVNLYPNFATKPTKVSLDLLAYYKMTIAGSLQLRWNLSVYNLLDQLNENTVNAQTGRAYTAIITDVDRARHRSNFNDFSDRVKNPAMYDAPRLIKLGLGISF